VGEPVVAGAGASSTLLPGPRTGRPAILSAKVALA